jgi:hypothetical protein
MNSIGFCYKNNLEKKLANLVSIFLHASLFVLGMGPQSQKNWLIQLYSVTKTSFWISTIFDEVMAKLPPVPTDAGVKFPCYFR